MNDLSLFFKNNQDKIEKNYPGINLNIFLKELDGLSLKNIDHLLMQGVPFAYIKKKTYFFKGEFLIDENCFIPRFETEILVEMALEIIKKNSHKMKVIDVGCGIGAIILMVMQESSKEIIPFATDVSEDAIKFTKLNLKQLGLKGLNIKKADRLNIDESGFDLILTNPPYIKLDDPIDYSASFSPKASLYVNNYLKWFDDFFIQIYDKLKTNGIFVMEGHEEHLKELLDLAKPKFGDTLKIIPDYTGRDRFMVGMK